MTSKKFTNHEEVDYGLAVYTILAKFLSSEIKAGNIIKM